MSGKKERGIKVRASTKLQELKVPTNIGNFPMRTLEAETCIENFMKERINQVKSKGWRLAQFTISEVIINKEKGERYFLTLLDCKIYTKKNRLKMKYFDKDNNETDDETKCTKVWFLL